MPEKIGFGRGMVREIKSRLRLALNSTVLIGLTISINLVEEMILFTSLIA